MTVRVEVVTPCEHDAPHRRCWEVDCDGEHRRTFTEWPPEAIEAMARTAYEDYTTKQAAEYGMGTKGRTWDEAAEDVKAGWLAEAETMANGLWDHITKETQ